MKLCKRAVQVVRHEAEARRVTVLRRMLNEAKGHVAQAVSQGDPAALAAWDWQTRQIRRVLRDRETPR